jgi:hypothetical protein
MENTTTKRVNLRSAFYQAQVFETVCYGPFRKWTSERYQHSPCHEQREANVPDYRIIADGPFTFKVEMTFPGGYVQIVGHFLSDAAARVWVAEREARNAEVKPRAP